MKRIVLSLILVVISVSAFAQSPEVKSPKTVYAVYFRRTVIPQSILNMKDKKQRENTIAAIEQGNRDFYMYLSGDEYAFNTFPAQEDLVEVAIESMYINEKEGVKHYTMPVIDKWFRIAQPFPPLVWNVTDETKQILGKTAIKALATEPNTWGGEDSITAWFTPEIPIPSGPEGYRGLPGLILELHNPRNQYILEKLEYRENAMRFKPASYKIVTPAEYQHLQEEAEKRLQVTHPVDEGGHRIIEL